MAQLFSNNAVDELASELTSGATSMTVTAGAQFQAPTGGDYELLTLTDGTNVEIVQCTARSGNTLTIVREQESTSQPASWPAGTVVSARVTAGTLAAMLTGGVVSETAGHAITIGAEADVAIDGTLHMAAAPIIPDDNNSFTTGDQVFRYYSAPPVILATDNFAMQSLGDDKVRITIPAGVHFYPDEIWLTIEFELSASSNPEIAIGTSAGGTDLLAQTEITKIAARERTLLTPLISDGIAGGTTIYVSVKVASSSARSGRVYLTGMLVED